MDTQHKVGSISHTFEYDLVRETQLNNLEKSRKEEESFTMFHQKATCEDCTHDKCQCELLETAKTNLDNLGVLWCNQQQRCDWNKMTDVPTLRNKDK